MEEPLLRELIQEGLMDEAEQKLRNIITKMDIVIDRLTCVKNILNLKVEDVEPNTEMFRAKTKIGAIIRTLTKEGITEKQRQLFDDALELAESAEKHTRWIREELGNDEPCRAETDILTVIHMLRNMKYR
jgi:hypothetical protein